MILSLETDYPKGWRVTCLSMLRAPSGDLRHQLQRQRFVVWQPDGPFADVIVPQPIRKRFHSLVAGVQADVLLECREVNQIVSFPVRRHTPGDFIHRVWNGYADGVVQLAQIGLDLRRLAVNVFLDRLGRLAAIMVLVGMLKRAPALRTLPHDIHLPK